MGKKIKMAIARMMAVLMVMTLIPLDMLAPARVVKAVGEDFVVYKHNFTGADGSYASLAGQEFFKVSGNSNPQQDKNITPRTYTDETDTVLTLKKAMKIESSTNISFTASAKGTLVMVCTTGFAGNHKIDGADISATDGITTIDLDAGSHTITKGTTTDLFYISFIMGTPGPTTKAPTPGIESGTEVIEGTKLTLTSETEDAAIYYTYAKGDATPDDPTADSTRYTEEGIVLDDLGTIKIKAIAISEIDGEPISSRIVTFTYTVKSIPEPTSSIVSGSKVQQGTTLELETEVEDAEIYYTLDGQEPTENSTKYDKAFSLGNEMGSVTVKAITFKGTKKSPVATFTYTITGPKLAAPTADTEAGAVPRGTKVTLSCSGGGKIYYTTDGSMPSKSSEEYQAPIEITEDMVIKAIALLETNADSDVATFEYTIKKPTIDKIVSGSEAILSGVALNGDITFENGNGAEIFNIGIKAEKVSDPSAAVKSEAEKLKKDGGEILYYDFTLVNKDADNDTVRVVKGTADAAILITMPYSIAASGANKLNEIIVLHGTEQIDPVSKEANGFSFSADSFSSYTVIVNPKDESKSLVDITVYAGYEEGAYAEWKAVANADGYMAYVAPAGGDTWTRIDDELIREYQDYWRVDTVGLAKGNYFIKIDAVTYDAANKTAEVIASDTTPVLKVTNYDRSGYAFSSKSPTKTGSGAYNDDGTLKEGALVLYVNNDNFNTISVTLKDSKGNDVTFTGIQDIVDESGVIKTAPTKPIDVRIIGTIDAKTGFPSSSWGSKAEGLQIKSNENNRQLTIEGIGEDAAVNGFGFLIRNCSNVELRNFAVMNFKDDGVSIDTKNTNLWIHDLDIYYGNAGGDSDQAKGDGSVDIKKSQYCTVSYNHFWDSGKCCLVDASAASSGGSDYLTYHHNWFDHSDSRHPRIRNGKNFHIYNNYYDGNSKYGVGVTTGSSAYVELNYFRNCVYPMMSSKQGTDALGDGTFSGEPGGIIKAYGNYMVGQQSFIPYSSQASTNFDAYVVNDPGTQVPASVKAAAGGSTYSNFDTAADMYDYVADTPEEAREKVISNAGRLNGGDLQFPFNNDVDDKSYDINAKLKAEVTGYSPSVKGFGGGVANEGVTVVEGSGGSTNVPGYTPSNISAPVASLTSRQVEKGTTITLSCSTTGASIYYTIDESTPTASSLPYTAGAAIVIDKTTVVKAIAILGNEKSDVNTYRYTVLSEGDAVDPTPGGDDNKFEIKTYMFNPEADEMEVAKLPAEVAQYGTNGYFTIDNTDNIAAISDISSNGNRKAAPAGTHGTQEDYAIRYSFGAPTTKDSKQAIRFTTEYAAKVYVGAYVSNANKDKGIKIYLDTDDNASASCNNTSTEYTFEAEAGEHVIYAKNANAEEGCIAYILYVVVEESVPVTPPAGTVAAPVASQASGDVPSGTKITLSSTTVGAKIYYTLNGTDPTATSTEYTGAIDLGNEEKKVTLKAVAIKDGTSSTVATFEYQVKADRYAITIDDGTNPVEKVIVAGTALTEDDLPATLTRDGYTFQGWVDEENNAITAPYTPTKSMRITAKWQSESTQPDPGPGDGGDTSFDGEDWKKVANPVIDKTDYTSSDGVDKNGKLTITVKADVSDKGGTSLDVTVKKEGAATGETKTSTTKQQQHTFVFAIPGPGKYEVTAALKRNGMEDKVVKKIVTVNENGQTDTSSGREGLYVELLDDDTDYVYTGSAIKPTIAVYNGDELLTEGTDYTVKYTNNVKAAKKGDAKAPTITVTGKGRYTGKTTQTFTIQQKSLNADDVKIGGLIKDTDTLVVAENAKISPIVVYKGMVLKAGDKKDFKLTTNLPKDKPASTDSNKTITIEGVNNYKDTLTLTLDVKKASDLKKISSVTVDKKAAGYEYNGEKKAAPITEVKAKGVSTPLKENDEYIVVYNGNQTSAGTQKFTVIGVGIYTGSKTSSFTISPRKNAPLKLTNQLADASGNVSCAFNSAGVTFNNKLTVKDEGLNNAELVLGKDYKVSYSANKKVGNGTYTVTFLGNYKGSAALKNNFTITAANLADMTEVNDPSEKEGLYLKSADKAYGKKAAVIKSAPFVLVDGVALKGSDYTVKYYLDENKTTEMKGKDKVDLSTETSKTVWVEITGKKNYTGTVMTSFEVVKPTTDRPTDISKAKIKVKDNKVEYTGEAVYPSSIEIKVGKNSPVTLNYNAATDSWSGGDNFDVLVVNNIAKGKATVIVTGTGSNVGSKTATFNVVAHNLNNEKAETFWYDFKDLQSILVWPRMQSVQ